MAAGTEKTYGMLARFESAGALLKAAEKMREAGYEKFDCHSPFPVHGLDAAMGLKRSPVGYIAGVCAVIGGALAFWLQWWTSTVDYPVVISGKPLFSYQAYIIVTFGLTVLGAALGAVFGMLFLNRLPQWFHGNFYSQQFSKFSDDSFFVSVEANDSKFDEEATGRFLREIGGSDPEVLRGE